jgi:hypothetical protein
MCRAGSVVSRDNQPFAFTPTFVLDVYVAATT